MPVNKKKSVGKSQQKGRKETTFFEILRQDHDNVRDIFDRILEDEEGKSREKLFSRLESEIHPHLQMEEDFFYPVLKESEETREKALEAIEEHNVVKNVLSEIENLDVDDERWEAKINVLKEVVDHHLEEEEDNVFKMAKKILEKEQIQEITNQMMQQKGMKEAA